MYRLLVSFCFCIILSVACYAENIDEATDAFSTETIINSSTNIEPALKTYLQNAAIKIKESLGKTTSSTHYTIKAHFDPSTEQLWHFDSIDNTDEAKLHCLELVEKTIKETHPPTAQPFNIAFIVDDLPITEVQPNGDIDFGPYMAALQRTIKSNFTVTNKPSKNTKTTIVFGLNKDGSIKNAHITTSSGFPAYDKAAMKALKNSAPFLPLPAGSSDIAISYTFNYDSHNVGHMVGRNYLIHLAQPSVIITETGNFLPKGKHRLF